MPIDKIYFIVMCVWLGINILITIYNLFSGKFTKKNVKNLLANILTLKTAIENKDNIVKGQVFPTEEVIKVLNKLENDCANFTVCAESLDAVISYLAKIRMEYCGGDNDTTST